MIRALALIVVAAVVLVDQQSRPATLDGLSRAALAQLEGSVRLRGLEAPVTVIRDRWGVPHIAAQSTKDLYFAQGFVMAQDRLWQMEMWRRGAEGRLAEVKAEGGARVRFDPDDAPVETAPHASRPPAPRLADTAARLLSNPKVRTAYLGE